MSMAFRVIVFEGQDLSALEDNFTPALTFDHLTWDEAIGICRASFKQGFGCVLWQREEGGDNE